MSPDTALRERLLPPGDAVIDHEQHLYLHGAVPVHRPQDLVEMTREAGLTGRGGAAFPLARKLAAVAAGSNPVVVGNGSEGEPASHKDATLLALSPHLVLDGLQLAARAVGARGPLHLRVKLAGQVAVLQRLADARSRHRQDVAVQVSLAPEHFLSGQETALLSHLEGGPALPRTPVRLTVHSGLRGAPTLVSNVETLAQLALVARHGPAWFRSEGTAAEPGTTLLTVSGAVGAERVVELPIGTPVPAALDAAGGTPRGVRGVLVGGYHGGWLAADEVGAARLSRADLQARGASLGAGVVRVLGHRECGLAATSQIVGYLARSSARQCGPCLNGLPRLAALFEELVAAPGAAVVAELGRIAGLVEGRGACHHPDGTVRLVRSALRAFGPDIDAHAAGWCQAGAARS